MTQLAWLILWVPFLAAVLIWLFLMNRPRVAGWLATLGMFAGLGMSLFLLRQAWGSGLEHFTHESSVVWIQAGGLHLEFGVLLNGLSLLMLLIVTGVGSVIFLYSIAYMHHEEGVSRYFACLSLFAFSMLGIVLANNLLEIFVFWELVGLSSYLLIGFWFQKDSAATAGKKAFLTNRVGDVGMMIGILILFTALQSQGLGTLNFLRLESVIPQAGFSAGFLTLCALLVFMGVAGKSAQVPLHVWLPDAMEGPTPVSALMHAATMVAAGVFLLARFFFLFSMSPDAMTVIRWVGVLTALIPGTIAIVQNDIKKILAYSTLSQLGYMVMAIGLGSKDAAMFHLATHAFFKALLFLGAGSLIHGMHTQDIWGMSHHSGVLKKMPVTGTTFLIGTLALMGIPPLSGFYSKEAILSAAASQGSFLLLSLSLIVVFLTAFYMGRLCTIVFFRPQNSHGHDAHAIHESSWLMLMPLAILAVFSVIAGSFPWSAFMGHAASGVHGAGHHGPAWLAPASIVIALTGFISAVAVFRKRTPSAAPASGVQKVLERKYFFDDVYDALIRYGQENIAKFSDAFERVVIVEGGANGSAALTRFCGKLLTQLQNGVVQFYALLFTLGISIMLFMLLRV